MKLTSKGMLKSLMLCAGMFSLSAVAATDYVADSFESGTVDSLVRNWRPDGQNLLWTSSAGESAQDASKVVAGSVSYQGAKPMDAERFGSPTDTKILSLDTMGETLSRNVSQSFLSTTLYTDTMVKFVVSEEAPTDFGQDYKIALYVNASSNLVVKGFSDPITISGLTIDPSQWYRLTIELAVVDSYASAKIYLNGSLISGQGDSGDWFWCSSYANGTFSNVAFQGTGSVDQLVVTDVNPYAPTVILLSLTGLDNATVTPAPTDGKIASGTEITISANTGFVLSNVTFTNTVVEGFRFGQSLTFTPVGAADDVIAISTVASGTSVTSFGEKSVNAGKLAAWLGAYANATTGSGDYDAYLLNVDPANYPTVGDFTIDSIAVSADSATISVSLGSVDLAAINGTLYIQKFTTLGGTPTEESVTLESDKTTVVNIDMTGFSFIKAVIK